MHHAVSAESIGAEEAGHIRNRPENAVVVGRHLVESRPGALGIDGDILEAGNAVGGAHQDLLDEGRLGVGLSRWFLRDRSTPVESPGSRGGSGSRWSCR